MSYKAFLKRNRFLSHGIPFFVLIIGGSFGLREFAQVRYDYRSQKPLNREEAEEMGVKMKPSSEVSIEKEFAKMKDVDIDTWENKRGPRPWEIDNPSTKEILERQQKRS